jgi:hypothetical protein
MPPGLDCCMVGGSTAWVMVEGRRSQVANRSFGSDAGLPGLVGDLLRRVRSSEGGIAKMCFGSGLWGCLHSTKGQHSTVYRGVHRTLAGRGSGARVHQYWGGRVGLGYY